MKKWVLIFLCLIGTFSFWRISTYFSSINREREHIRTEHTRRYIDAVQKAHDDRIDIRHRLAAAHTLEEWEGLFHTDLSDLPEGERQRIRAIIKSKLFEMLFWRAETLLARARGLLEQDQNNIMAGAYIEEARKIYERAKEFMPDLNETPGDSLWNARLYYLKGAYYARSLAFIKIQEEKSKAEDALAQSITNFDKALFFAPKDHDTQVAIEVLQKIAKNISSSSGTSDNKKLELQLLPGKDKEIGPFQIGPRQEGKH